MPERVTPAPVAPPDYASLAKEMPALDAPAPAAAPAAPAPEKPAEKAPEENKPAENDAVGTPFEKGFARLATAQSDFRKEKDAAKHGLSLAKVVSPVQAAALEKALTSNDPMAAMVALGYSYADIAARVAGAPAAKKDEPAVKPAEAPAKDEDPEIAEIKARYRAQAQQEQKATILGGIKGVVTSAGDKFKHIAGLEDFEGVSGVLDELWKRGNGSFPSENGLENIAIAAEEYERRLREGEVTLTKKQWETLQNLTTAPSSGSTPPEAPRDRPGNAPVSTAKTLTNRTGAPVAPIAPRPAASPDYDALARELP